MRTVTVSLVKYWCICENCGVNLIWSMKTDNGLPVILHVWAVVKNRCVLLHVIVMTVYCV